MTDNAAIEVLKMALLLERQGMAFYEPVGGETPSQIGAASFEAAAISAAIDMENKAVALYSQRAGQAADPAERDLYQWLADWERGHQRFLARINQELLEEIWQDSGFWPF